MRLESFYSDIAAEHLTGHAHQWASLTACAQERLVYRTALVNLRAGAKCLDWGCGNGHFAYFLARHGYSVQAYALDEKPALIARAGIAYTKGRDVTALPFESSTFDAVFGVGVLEHVYERGGQERGSLLELARVLRLGGKLFIFHLPNRFSWIEWLVRVLYRAGISTKLPHEKRYSKRDFLALLEGTGLTCVEHGRYHILPRAILNRLPRSIRDAAAFCATVDALDDALSSVLRPFCQNWYFILEKAAN